MHTHCNEHPRTFYRVFAVRYGWSRVRQKLQLQEPCCDVRLGYSRMLLSCEEWSSTRILWSPTFFRYFLFCSFGFSASGLSLLVCCLLLASWLLGFLFLVCCLLGFQIFLLSVKTIWLPGFFTSASGFVASRIPSFLASRLPGFLVVYINFQNSGFLGFVF